jgi:hypothetical protein
VLADLGYDLQPESDGERIMPHAITTKMIVDRDGALAALTEGSTQAVITARGIAWTRRWSFHIP